MSNNHLKAILITALGVFIMSFESLLIKLSDTSSLTYSFYIGVFMILSINILMIKDEKKDFIKAYQGGFLIILLCGALFGISNMFFISAINNTSVANTVMILSTAPLFSSLYAYIFYRQKSTKNIYISSLFIFIGLFVIFYAQDDKSSLIGNIYAFICANLFSLAFVFLSQHKKINRFAVTSSAGFFILIISFVLSDSLEIDINTLYVLIIAGLFVSPISRVLMGIGTKTLPASEVSLLMIIETIMAPIWVWIILEEVPSINTFIGGSIILATLVLNSIYLIHINKKSLTSF